ncbi:MAG: MFS transporter [Sphingomonadales bacterium]|nr:MFS transporter [Sphingomonadales bacterium]MDE2569531.1 MFS transporter [Sphingomonadales bacterium]
MSETHPVPSGRLAPIWLMGLANAVLGLNGALLLVTIPQLLAARGVPETEISTVTAIGLIPAFAVVLIAPVLDVRLTRRAYCWIFGPLAAVLSTTALFLLGDFALLVPVVLAAQFCVALYVSALGGWLGASLPKEADGQLAVWFNIGNGGGFGIGAAANMWFYQHLPHAAAFLAAGALLVVPLPLLLLPPAPREAVSQLNESFGRLARDVGALLRQPPMRRLLLLFALPCASFALTNMFGGIGNDFGASPAMVAWVSGWGVLLPSLLTSLVAGVILKFLRPPVFYLLTGVVGASVTLATLLLPRTPETFIFAVVAENVFQTAAFTIQNAIMFRSIAPDSPVAATQFAVLTAAVSVPISYMQALDGRGYGLGGLSGAFLTDALLSLTACALIAVPVLRWMRSGGFEAEAPAPATPR